MSETKSFKLEIKVLKDANDPTAKDRYGVYLDGKRIADCAKPTTAVNSMCEALKGAANGLYPFALAGGGTQNKKWDDVVKITKKPEYTEAGADLSAILGGNTEAVEALTQATGTRGK